MIRPIWTTLPLAAGLGLAFLASPASAQDDEIVVSGKADVPPGTSAVTKVVSIADLDLSTERGAEEMEKRVTAAIKQICWSHPKPARWQVKDSEECDAFAWSGARPQMDAALARAGES